MNSLNAPRISSRSSSNFVNIDPQLRDRVTTTLPSEMGSDNVLHVTTCSPTGTKGSMLGLPTIRTFASSSQGLKKERKLASIKALCLWNATTNLNTIAFWSNADHSRMHVFSYTWSFLVTCQWRSSHHSIRHSRKAVPHANFMAMFIAYLSNEF